MKPSFFIALLAFVLVSGCEKKDNPVAENSVGTYVGYFTSIDTSAGLIVINVESSGSVSGNAWLWEDTLTTVTVTGTISGGSFTGSASDGTPLVATLSNSTITGNANGGEATFTLHLAAGSVTVQKYVGSYTSTTGPPESGPLFIATAATTMWGVVFESGGTGEVDYLVGTITGTTLSARQVPDLATEVASGSFSSSTWSGTYTGSQGGGTWSVALVP